MGGVLLATDPIEYNTGRKTVKLVVRNTGDRPVQVGSHFHLFEVNRYLEFDRDATFGFHLNIPATTAVRFEPGDQKEVEAVVFGGKRRVIGFNALVMGYTGDEDAPTYFPARLKAVRKVRLAGFKEIAEKEAEAAYKKQQGRATPHPDPENPYGWCDSSVVKILERREYTGCTVNFKTYTNSIWDKKQRENPVEKQTVFPDTHARIIEDDVFEKVQVIRQQRHRMTRTGRSSIFSGLVYCADCGSKMQYGSSNNGDFAQDFFDCSLHKKHREKCGGHFIRVKVLEQLVLKHMQLVMWYILRHEDYFRFVMEQQMKLESAEKFQVIRKQLNWDEKRITELKRLFIKIYEDNANGCLSDERFDMLSQGYEAEQKQLEAKVISLRQDIEVQERQNENIEKFIQKAHKYVGIETLDPYALRELVQAIYVEAPDKSSGKRRQSIHIKYDGMGFIPLDELMKGKK